MIAAKPLVFVEEKGFEPSGDLRRRRFSNSIADHARECTERIAAGSEGLRTTGRAPNGTEVHRDHGLDHRPDHGTKSARPKAVGLAERVMRAIEDEAPESLELAAAMVEEVLSDPILRRALVLERLLAEGSPFALVRALELAKSLSARSE